ncbi:hypothetical protein IWX81_002060 [Salinibacterium sp. CAN_S4]|uniref:SdrD B-like domain-containing protein n=1 Tax=Salinibacterium sp. CAN_S4 TaxID=2787727 RepID=UPI0018F01AE2
MHTRRVLSRLPSSVALLTAAVLVFSGSAIAAGTSAARAAAAGTVSGHVFRDFNANGLRDTIATPHGGVSVDTGITGVVVTAYDSDDTVFATTTVSSADGSYTLTGSPSPSPSDQLRVEFTGLPAGFEETPVFSSTGTRSGTSVQFVAVGASGVDFGAGVPEEYSQNNPPVVTAIQYSGIPTSTSANQPSIVAQAYSTNFSTAAAQGTGFPGRSTMATFSQVGSVWGVAYNAAENDLFAAATYKRHSGLGTLGLGGIYRVTDVVTNGSVSTSGTTVQPWLDVTTLGIDVGTALSNSARGLSAGNVEARDIDAFQRAGKIGIGGVATSLDGTRLYFVNLFDKTLVTLDISDLAAPAVASVTSLGLTTGQRPWAVTVRAGQVFVGYVTTGETLVGGVETANPGVSAAAAGLSAGVIATDMPVTAASMFQSVLNAPLGYAKGDVYANVLAPQSQRWNTWADSWTWPALGGVPAGSVAQTTGTGSRWQIYPSAVLEGLSFDAAGFLTLGFGDRTGIQGGNRNHPAQPTDTSHYETGSSGDILIAAPNAAGTAWTIESAGTAGTRAAAGLPAGRATNNQGPGGGEFFADAINQGKGNTHQEVALGALASMRGTEEVVATQYDPLSGIRLAGLSWLSTTTGEAVGGYEHNVDAGGAISVEGTFQKGGGLGGIQILAEQAPLEIGNRAWFDADQDGSQNADEPPLSGVTVQLWQGGAVLKEVVTGADGTYYFSTDSDSPFYAPGFTSAGGDYIITFVTPTSGNVAFGTADQATFGTVPWNILELTRQDAGSNQTDSDPDAAGNVSYSAAPAGESDHSIDAGFIANASFTIAKQLAAGSGPARAGQVFSIAATAVDFRGNAQPLPDSPVTVAAGDTSSAISAPVGSRVTVTESNGGQYRSATVTPATPTLASAEAPTAFTVTNDLFDVGQFRISKTVTGPGGSLIPLDQSFTVSYTYPGLASPKTLTVTKGGTSALSDEIPYGTIVTLSEATPTGGPAGVGWDTPGWSKGSGTGVVTDNGDGTSTLTIGDASTVSVDLVNPTTVTPAVTILRGDLVGPSYHAADTITDGEVYTPGETRDVVFTVTNSGTEELRDVVLGDSTNSGPAVSDITWTFPDGSTVTTPAGTSVEWPNSFDGTSTWIPGAVITGTASLTVDLGDQPHIATATVDAVGTGSGTPVSDSNDYNAFTGGIQVIKYDGNLPDPAIVDGSGAGSVPAKSSVPAPQNADSTADAVTYPVNTAQSVRMVVSNTGTTPLTTISLADLTTDGPALNGPWIADLSAFGGPADFDFGGGAVWTGVLKPGESFYAESSLTLPVSDTHAGDVTVLATVVVPVLDRSGLPHGEPTFDVAGDPVTAHRNGAPATVTDSDPFNARTGVGPQLGIQLGDGTGTTIIHDANTMPQAEVYQPGETRPIVFTVTNTGTEALRDISLISEVLSGVDLDGPIVWTFPDGSTATSSIVNGTWVVEWPNSFDGTSAWAPGDVITGISALTLHPSDPPHVSTVTVTGTGVLSGADVTATDPYNAFTGAIQVIEYDGTQPDPAVKAGSGDWIIPSKPAVGTSTDADTISAAVIYEPRVAQAVRWVVTNTGSTAMTNLTLTNLAGTSASVGADWTADLSPLGGPSDYNFAASGPWTGILLPGQSFYASGTLTLEAGETHSNIVTVTGHVIVPEVDGAGIPTGQPSTLLGVPQLATLADGSAFIVTSSDPFNAVAPAAAPPFGPFGPGLAFTGTAAGLPLAIGLLLLVGGLLLVSRRRVSVRP